MSQWCCYDCDRGFINSRALEQHLSSSIHQQVEVESELDFYCHECSREFVSESALDQHLTYAPAHQPKFSCDACARDFVSQYALDQHLEYSPIHQPTYSCDDCNRDFVSQSALDQHLIYAPAHQPKFSCDSCARDFVSEDALDQHLAYSPAHQPTYSCNPCGRDFVSQSALDQHLSTSSVHATATQFHCCECARDFGSEAALEQHLRDKYHSASSSQLLARAELWCRKCDRLFSDEDALRKHLASVKHNPIIDNVKCIAGGSTGCNKRVTSPSAMLHHLESGACSSGINRLRIDQVISQNDTTNIITSGIPTSRGPTLIDTGLLSLAAAGEVATGGKCACPLPQCTRKFKSPQALLSHLNSPAHAPKIYRCPLPLAIGSDEDEDEDEERVKMGNFSTLSGLAQHLESGACHGGNNTFRAAMRMVNERLGEMGLRDMRVMG